MQSLEASRSRKPGKSPPDGALISRSLGYFSLALGATELVAPRQLARLIGLEPKLSTSVVMRLFGLREIAAGINILMQPRRPLPIWARVAGDALDMAALAYAATDKSANKPRALLALAGLAGCTALDAVSAMKVQALQEQAQEPIMFSVTVNKTPIEAYNYFRDLSHLPSFMTWLESVRELSDGTSHWIAKLPVGGVIEWDAEITSEKIGEELAWKTRPGSPFMHEGKVTFAQAPGRKSTEIRVEMQAELAGFGRKSSMIAKLLAKPQIKGDLRRLKQILETGEVLLSDASLHKGPHPAQPSTVPDKTPALDPESPGSGAPLRTSSRTGQHDGSSTPGPDNGQLGSVPASTSQTQKGFLS